MSEFALPRAVFLMRVMRYRRREVMEHIFGNRPLLGSHKFYSLAILCSFALLIFNCLKRIIAEKNRRWKRKDGSFEALCPEKTQSIFNLELLELQDELSIGPLANGDIVLSNETKLVRESELVVHDQKDDNGVGSKNSTATIGLTRSGRRHLAFFLDEFWGHLFDSHGHLTEKAKIIRADMLFDLDLEVPSTSVKTEMTGNGAFGNNSCNTETRSECLTRSTSYDAAMQVNFSASRKLIKHSFMDERGGQSDDFSGAILSLDKLANEQSKNLNISILKSEVKEVACNDPYQSEENKSHFCQAVNPIPDSKPLWAPQLLEGKFVTKSLPSKCGEPGVFIKPSTSNIIFSYRESEALVLHSFRVCIGKILNLEGSDWLFTGKGGYDEELINLIAAAERFKNGECSCKLNQAQMGIEEEVSKLCSSIPGFGEGCVWHADLIVSFGIWCIRRILELLHVENRPELWGRYTYVLNRLQGILIPAFLKHRRRIVPCKCLDHPNMTAEEFKQILGRLSRSHCTTADLILQMLKGVEAAISRRRGQAGTAAGDVAFPKGKENVASVLKRYKRRLSKKSSGTKLKVGTTMIR